MRLNTVLTAAVHKAVLPCHEQKTCIMEHQGATWPVLSWQDTPQGTNVE